MFQSNRWATGQRQKKTPGRFIIKSVVAAASDTKKTSWEPVKHYSFLPLPSQPST